MFWDSRCIHWQMSSRPPAFIRSTGTPATSGGPVAAGVYLSRLHYSGEVQTRRLLYLK